MINIKKNKTLPLVDPWRRLGKKRRALLDKGWPGLFRTQILPQLPADRLASDFSDSMGAPTKELTGILGALVLQQQFDLTDEETAWAYTYHLEWQYALDVTGDEDKDTYLSERSVRSYRSKVIEKDLDRTIFEGVTDHLIDLFQVSTKRQRQDSTFLQSNMRCLHRVELCTEVIRRYLRQAENEAPALYDRIPLEIRERYRRDGGGCFGLKPSESRKVLSQCGEDLQVLVEGVEEDPEVREWTSTEQMKTVLSDQFSVSVTKEAIEVTARPSKELSTKSLQSPTDPDARYDGIHGPGYHAQVAETYTRDEENETEGDEAEEEKKGQESHQPHLITYVEVTPGNERDEDAVMPAVENLERRGKKPGVMPADTPYGSDENVEACKKKSVTLVAPVKGKKPARSLEGFEADEVTGEMVLCPMGYAPFEVKKNRTKYAARFPSSACEGCERADRCPAQRGKSGYTVRYTRKDLRLARRRQDMETEAFRLEYRYRAGIEGANSQYKNQMGGRRVRYRGLKRVTFAVMMKFLGVNLARCARVWGQEDRWRGNLSCFRAIWRKMVRLLVSMKKMSPWMLPEAQFR